MPSTTAMMKLPSARAGQIRALAAAKGIGATEALEHLLNLAIEAGEIADVLPGFEVVRDGSLVCLTLDGQRLPGMLPHIALRVAENLEHAGLAQAVGKGRPVFFHRHGGGSEFQADLMVATGRHGSGVVIALEEVEVGREIGSGKRTTASLTRGMAVDLARQIRKAAQAS